MSDELQHEFDRLFIRLKECYPEFDYNQLESRINAHLSSELSRFRHRVNNPDQYTGFKYDPEGKLKIPDEEPIDDKDVIFFSSQIVAC